MMIDFILITVANFLCFGYWADKFGNFLSFCWWAHASEYFPLFANSTLFLSALTLLYCAALTFLEVLRGYPNFTEILDCYNMTLFEYYALSHVIFSSLLVSGVILGVFSLDELDTQVNLRENSGSITPREIEPDSERHFSQNSVENEDEDEDEDEDEEVLEGNFTDLFVFLVRFILLGLFIFRNN